MAVLKILWKQLLFVDSLKTLKEKSKKSGNTYMIMRHGQTEHNLKGLWNFGDTTDSLTTEGKNQVIATAQSLQKKPDIIISSPYVRTMETAKLIASECGVKEQDIITDNQIVEWNVGQEFDGKPLDNYFAVRNKDADRYGFKTEDGESYAEVFTRASQFLYEIEKNIKVKLFLLFLTVQ
jgi:broad specificity phosphatase PhoE